MHLASKNPKTIAHAIYNIPAGIRVDVNRDGDVDNERKENITLTNATVTLLLALERWRKEQPGEGRKKF